MTVLRSLKKPPANLGARRADKSDKAADWTAIDMLRFVLSEWEAHPEQMPDAVMLGWLDKDSTGTYFIAGKDVENTDQQIMLCEMIKLHIFRDATSR